MLSDCVKCVPWLRWRGSDNSSPQGWQGEYDQEGTVTVKLLKGNRNYVDETPALSTSTISSVGCRLVKRSPVSRLTLYVPPLSLSRSPKEIESPNLKRTSRLKAIFGIGTRRVNFVVYVRRWPSRRPRIFLQEYTVSTQCEFISKMGLLNPPQYRSHHSRITIPWQPKYISNMAVQASEV